MLRFNGQEHRDIRGSVRAYGNRQPIYRSASPHIRSWLLRGKFRVLPLSLPEILPCGTSSYIWLLVVSIDAHETGSAKHRNLFNWRSVLFLAGLLSSDLGVGENPMPAEVRARPVQMGAVRALQKGDVRLKFKSCMFEIQPGRQFF